MNSLDSVKYEMELTAQGGVVSNEFFNITQKRVWKRLNTVNINCITYGTKKGI